MGTLVGHVAPGFGFLLIGFWHLFNHTKLHFRRPSSYVSSPWFPSSISRYLELYLIMAGSLMSISMELVIGPDRHQPFDPDGTIPSNHLHNFEHSSISFSFFAYAALALALDRVRPRAHGEVTQLLAAAAFAQQLLLFHLHSADHMGVEGQYHLLLQLVILVSVATTLIGIRLPRSFLTSFVRSLSIAFQGLWLIVMGLMLWTPGLIPKGCRLNSEEGHQVVRCEGEAALGRAKSLVNLQFSWFMGGTAIFAVVFFLAMGNLYGKATEYRGIVADDDKVAEEEVEDDDVESQKKQREETKSFLQMGKVVTSRDMER
ncbi:hypothetical protein H6P81_004367 [Aristolochia fimbriata]|uniref:Uncharacterized protein n=1 Tax=Aristolochia fimbriata TaxID=158543 RepID=A0AAV7FGS9_ARIFI|nr:hypothetical protein H6P81_004367 [Aristolochia fimbriata]